MNEYYTLLRKNSDYRSLWLGSLISQLGDWFNLLASASLITDLTDSGIAISYLFLARFLPLFLFSPFAGVLADRYSRRMIMILADLLRAVTVAAFLFIRSPEHIWLFYLLTIIQFTLSSLFTPAKSAILATVVEPEDLVAANALDAFTWSTMLAVGALIGGLVAALFGAEVAFVADSATFLLSALFISRIVGVERTKSEGPGRAGWLTFIDGFRYLWGEPFILTVTTVKAGGAFVWGAINVLEINFAEQVFPLDNVSWMDWLNITDGSTATLGIIYLVVGFGTGLGPLFVRRWLGDTYQRLLTGITIGFLALAIGIAGLSVAPNFEIFLFFTLLRTIGTGVIWVFSAALLQMVVPDRYRGRVFAFEFALLTLTQSISIFTAGLFQDSGMSVQDSTAVIGIFGFVVWALWVFIRLRYRYVTKATFSA